MTMMNKIFLSQTQGAARVITMVTVVAQQLCTLRYCYYALLLSLLRFLTQFLRDDWLCTKLSETTCLGAYV